MELGVGKRISAAAKVVFAGTSGGTMEKEDIVSEVPLGAAGISCDVSALEVS
jgi:hypothetical protein